MILPCHKYPGWGEQLRIRKHPLRTYSVQPTLCWALGCRGDRTEELSGPTGWKSLLGHRTLSHNYKCDVSRRRWAARAYDRGGQVGKGLQTASWGSVPGLARWGVGRASRRARAETGMALDGKGAGMVRAE